MKPSRTQTRPPDLEQHVALAVLSLDDVERKPARALRETAFVNLLCEPAVSCLVRVSAQRRQEHVFRERLEQRLQSGLTSSAISPPSSAKSGRD